MGNKQQENNKSAVIQLIIRQIYSPHSQKLIFCATDIFSIDQQHIWKRVLKHRDWQQIKVVRFRNDMLTLVQCEISGIEVPVITNMNWPNLKVLMIDRNKIGDIGSNLIWKNQWPQLTDLWLCSNQISPKGLASIPNLPFTQQLRVLSLNYNPIGSKGAELLSKADMPALQRLEVHCCRIGNAGVQNLGKSRWKMLKVCCLNENRIVYNGLYALINYNCVAMERMEVIHNVNIWEIVCLTITNAHKSLRFDGCYYPNDLIGKNIDAIFRSRFTQ